MKFDSQPILILFLIGSFSACGPSSAEVRRAVETSQVAVAHARQSGAAVAERLVVDEAAALAMSQLFEATSGFDAAATASYEAQCRELVASGERARAGSCLNDAESRGHRTIPLALIRADLLTMNGEYADARRVLFWIRDQEPMAEGLQRRLNRAFADDPFFNREVLTIEPNVHLTRISSLGGGSTITLKFKMGDENIAAFKPNQTRRQSNYRAEVAAFRFCAVMRCGFEVPYSFEARIERRDFMRLYGIASLEGNTGYASNFVDLVWTRDDEGTFWLYGVWKDWVPHFTQFPIEYDDVWDSWVNVEADSSELDVPLDLALLPLQGRERGHYNELLEEAGSLTTRGLARQISNMLVFDFLINNWDRFSTAYWGVNCQFANGQFVSIDNGAGFMTREPSHPREHLHQVTRFSRSAIQEVRLLDREALLPLLFPGHTDDEVLRYEAFWERREELLDYVDGLITEHGEDAVIFFE